MIPGLGFLQGSVVSVVYSGVGGLFRRLWSPVPFAIWFYETHRGDSHNDVDNRFIVILLRFD